MEFLKLYDEENRDILYSMSWLNKNSNFDKSIGNFENIDLFTFLENISSFDYEKDIIYDDVYFIIEYTQDSIFYLINNINKEMKREHKIVPISQAKEFDKKTILWLSRQDGRTIKEKLKNNKIKTVKRYMNVDTYENRILKNFLKKLVSIEEKRAKIQSNDKLISKIRQWLRSDDAKNINEYGNVVYNNILLHHPYYSKIFKSYKWLNILNEKLDIYKSKLKNLKEIIYKFEVLTSLQFNTNIYVLPRKIVIERDLYNILLINPLVDMNIDELLEKNIYKKLENINFQNINVQIKNELKSIITTSREFKIDTSSKEIFMDFFRLFPIARTNEKLFNFPITLKQEIEGKIINANNTKIIDLNHKIFTLPMMLDNFEPEILKYFFNDFLEYFQDKKLNYIIPDYVNIFEFSNTKRMINSYFKKNKAIPKSVLAGLSYLFYNKLKIKENDTLIYIQKNQKNELFVTPLLIKYNKELKQISNGFYIERFPTKKLDVDNDDIIKSLETIFDKETSIQLFNTFLQNGLKAIKNQNIVFYKDNKIFNLDKLIISNSNFNQIEEIKKLYNTNILFKNKNEFIKDSNEENLATFEKIIEYENNGFSLWREHLPDLSMEIQNKGYFDQFILVDDKSELVDKHIIVNNNFLIPKGANELSFPLNFGDEKIDYKAYLSSNDLPYNEDVECKLNLTYDFERENPYRLIFEPINSNYRKIYVEWKKQTFEDIILPVPNYPENRTWNDFTKFIDNKGKKVNLLKKLSENLEKIIEIEKFYNKTSSRIIYVENIIFEWRIDKNNTMYSISNIPSIGKVFFHENQYEIFETEANNLTFELEKSDKGFKAKNIARGYKLPTNFILDFIENKRYRFPLLTIFNNGNKLSDIDVSNEFRQLMYEAIESALFIYKKTNNDKLKKEIFFFLCSLNSSTSSEVNNMLSICSQEFKSFKINMQNIAYSLGTLDLDWQKNIFKNIFKYMMIKDEKIYSEALKVFAIISWRYENFILILREEDIIIVAEKLYQSLKLKIDSKSFFDKSKYENKLIVKDSINMSLELLLALIRYRNKKNDFLHPKYKLTKNFQILVDKITKYIIDNKIELRLKRFQLNIDKPDKFRKVPDILYALRVYLSADNGAANSIKVLGVSDD
ncbi:hypothetical protein [Aliarcobacter butzleri]|uniref:hypothetical protein n=1 Tax=Aliarcobacter butzleri TaxID=28197 RepID=UPI00102DFB86|nr:hypothetical protein [Aliarcobacter butzleri]RZV16511.1 hypothetical protein D3M75_09495 [Aliarcobacter butzleri]